MREVAKTQIHPISPQKTTQKGMLTDYTDYEEVKRHDFRVLVNIQPVAVAETVAGLLGTGVVLSGFVVLKTGELCLRGFVYVLIWLCRCMSRPSRSYDSMSDNPCRQRRGHEHGQRSGQNMQFNNCHNITINNY
jgi:hypothetical protein